jgi:hypothetical protein
LDTAAKIFIIISAFLVPAWVFLRLRDARIKRAEEEIMLEERETDEDDLGDDLNEDDETDGENR